MHKLLMIVLLALSAGAFGGFAQESLLLGPGDQIHVQVFDTPEMDQHPRVTDAGNVPLLFVGDIKVGGLSPGDAALVIEKALQEKNFMLHPHVAITIDDLTSMEVSVTGQVKDAGVYQITAPKPILNVLSMAGGLTDVADRHITIQRHGNTGERLSYYYSNGSDQALTPSVLVYPGDTVLVTKAPVVYVMGDVGRPGGYPVDTNDSKMSVLQAIALAGAPNKTATLGKTRLLRKNSSGLQDETIDLASIEKGSKPDIQMQPDDILYVPFSWMKNAALASSAIATSATSALIYAHP